MSMCVRVYLIYVCMHVRLCMYAYHVFDMSVCILVCMACVCVCVFHGSREAVMGVITPC